MNSIYLDKLYFMNNYSPNPIIPNKTPPPKAPLKANYLPAINYYLIINLHLRFNAPPANAPASASFQ